MFNHVQTCHTPEYLERYAENHPLIERQRTIQNIYGGSETAKRIWFWNRKVFLIPLLFISVEIEVMREGLAYRSITHNTLKKVYDTLKRCIIFEKINPHLVKNTGRFGAIYDRRSYEDEHYFAVFSSYCDEDGVVKTPMLSCSVGDDMDEETLFSAQLDENDIFFGFTADNLFYHIMLTFHNEYDVRLPDEHGNLTIELMVEKLARNVWILGVRQL